LVRNFGGTAVQRAGRWGLQTEAGTWFPFDDGREKSFDERLRDPDLEDMFSLRYETNRGAGPVARGDFDPGRFRVEYLFKAAFGASAKEVARRLVEVELLGTRVRIHEKAAPSLRKVNERLTRVTAQEGQAARSVRAQFVNVGTFNWRTIDGTQQLSAHSFGIAIDLNPKLADYWRWSRRERWGHPMPRVIVDAFEAEGFIWGGAWSHYDSMHFEYRPELFDAQCFSASR
jgi:hypothetical protein